MIEAAARTALMWAASSWVFARDSMAPVTRALRATIAVDNAVAEIFISFNSGAPYGISTVLKLSLKSRVVRTLLFDCIYRHSRFHFLKAR
jgi:hypothetical protein